MKHRPATGSRGDACAGFTLIEIVVALALVGLIAVGAFESLRFGQRAYARIIDQGAQSWRVVASQRLIRGLIESAYPQEPIATQPVAVHGLEGGKESVSVTAAAPLATAGAGLYRYEIGLRRTAAGRNDVIVRWRPDFSDPWSDGGARGAEETLIEDVATIEWSYQADESAESEPQSAEGWRSDWRGRHPLPRLVRLRVKFPAGDTRVWPDLIIAPRITDDANCEFDVVSQRCRTAT